MSFNHSLLRYGYLVCTNKVIDAWILQGMGSFSKSHFKENILVLRRVSFDVDWIENITKIPFAIPDDSHLAIPKIGNVKYYTPVEYKIVYNRVYELLMVMLNLIPCWITSKK